jgi:uncharacterized membrane protein YjgN (DUF898 family)
MIIKNKVVDLNDVAVVGGFSFLFLVMTYIIFTPIIYHAALSYYENNISFGISDIVLLSKTLFFSILMFLIWCIGFTISFFGFLGQNTAGLRFGYKWFGK